MIPQLECLSPAQLTEISLGSEVLEQDGRGLKVLRLASGEILKFFRVKRWLSSASLLPYCIRFCKHAELLQSLGVPTLTPLRRFSLQEERNTTAVLYRPLAGETLRRLEHLSPALLEQLGEFIAGIHAQGVYFRSLHLGNVVLTPEGQLGLIDIADLRCYRLSLCRHMRARNFEHMLRDAQDIHKLGRVGLDAISRGYGRIAPHYTKALDSAIAHAVHRHLHSTP